MDGAYIPATSQTPSKSKSIAMEHSNISMNDHIASPSSTNLMAALLLLELTSHTGKNSGSNDFGVIK